jgi:peroxiredoxin
MTRTTARLHTLLALLLLALSPALTAQAQEFVWAPTLAVGSPLPPIDAVDQNGERQTLTSLSGEKGLVLVLSRSFDWCPYCIAQLERLVERQADFAALGFNVAAMTYDPVATLKEAEEEYGATFPLLYDEGNTHVKAMGILNTQYSPGERAYGIPYPGIFVLDAQGVIRAKLAEEDYKLRPDFSLVLEAAAGL